jgi:hypothetical protein
MTKKTILIIFIASLLIISLAACASQNSSTPGASGNPPSGTLPAGGPMDATAVEDTATTEPTAAPTATATPQPTATPVTFEATVITSIMCQTGPGENYERYDYLKQGETLLTFGRDADTNYFLIEAPNKAGTTCWVWKNYVTVEGNGYTLPIATVTASN